MMKTVLTILGGILIGPVAGYYVMYWLSYLNHHGDCMWRFGAHFGGLLMGAPIGAITFGGFGFWLGYRLDKKLKQRQLENDRDSDTPCQGTQASQ